MDERKLGPFLQDRERRCNGTETSWAEQNIEEMSQDAEAVPLTANQAIPLNETVKLTEDGTKFLTDAILHFEQQRRIQQRRRHFWN